MDIYIWLPWLVILLIAAAWFAVRHLIAPHIGTQPMAHVRKGLAADAIADVKIVSDYADFTAKGPALPYDVNLLPHPKEAILAAIEREIVGEPFEARVQHLKNGMYGLWDFQEGGLRRIDERIATAVRFRSARLAGLTASERAALDADETKFNEYLKTSPVADFIRGDNRKAADQRDAEAEFEMGNMYIKGNGDVPQDLAMAGRWYAEAAEHGHAKAQFILGVMYGGGLLGAGQDYAEAVRWYRKAAERGEARAQSNLGLMYVKGHGVQQDYVQAYKWLSLAEAGGHKLSAEDCDLVIEKMTTAQIADARKLAREWKPK